MARFGETLKGVVTGVGRAAKSIGHRLFGFLAKGGKKIGTGIGTAAEGIGEGGQELLH